MKSIKKSLIAALIAAVVVFGAAGQALAAFAENYLVRVVYTTNGTVEVATNLGNVNDLVGSTNATVGGGDAAFNLGMFGEGAQYSDLRVAYVTINYSLKDVWVSSDATAPVSGVRQMATINSAYTMMKNYYNTLTSTAGTVVADKTYVNSYYALMDKNSLNIGGFTYFIQTGKEGSEANLATLATVGYVDQYLYYFASGDSAQTGVQVATIRTWADGSTTINYNPVPVPPGVFLLGGGLLGLLGLRRRTGLAEA